MAFVSVCLIRKLCLRCVHQFIQCYHFSMARFICLQHLSISPITFSGVIIVPSAGVGIVLGGYIIKKLKLGARESAKLAMICSGVSLLCFSTLFIVGCESINLGGINIPYTTG